MHGVTTDIFQDHFSVELLLGELEQEEKSELRKKYKIISESIPAWMNE